MAPVAGLIVSACYIYLFMLRPFKEEEVCTLGIILQYAMVFIFTAALTVLADTSDQSEEEETSFGVILTLIVFVGPMAIATQTTIAICRWCCSKKKPPLSTDDDLAAAADDPSKKKKKRNLSITSTESGASRSISVASDAGGSDGAPSITSMSSLDTFSPSMANSGTPLEGTDTMKKGDSNNPWAAAERFDEDPAANRSLSPTTSTKMMLLEKPSSPEATEDAVQAAAEAAGTAAEAAGAAVAAEETKDDEAEKLITGQPSESKERPVHPDRLKREEFNKRKKQVQEKRLSEREERLGRITKKHSSRSALI